jgi:PAS domain S-box-containing protein
MTTSEKTRILIVDDDETFTKVTAASLEHQGYRVETANTGQQALDKVSSGTQEIVLLDLILPDADGTEILQRIGQLDRSVAVIAVTGYGDEQRAVKVMKAGSCDYLTKPFRLRDLFHAVEKAAMWREIQIIEHMAEGYVAVEKGRIAYANRLFLNLVGYSREELNDMEVERVFPDHQPFALDVWRSRPAGGWHDCQIQAIHRDGTRHTFTGRVGKDTFQARTVVAAFLRDITVTKHLEDALKETQTLYENLILNANDAITLINPKGTFALVNPKFCEISGYSEDEAKSLHYSKLVHPDDLPLFTDRYARALAGEEVPSNYQFRIVRKTGEFVFVDFSANAIKKKNRIIGIQAIARDITERKRAERELQERMEELEKWHRLTVDRELRMIELKKRIQELESKLSHFKRIKGIQ